MTGSEARGPVLVVEDDRAIADLVELYLRRDGFDVLVATDGTAALDAVRRHRPVAVVLDVGLPGRLDGLEVCRRMRADGDGTPVLFVTARDDEPDRIRGLELGADDYVSKPFSPRELVLRVHTVLRRTGTAEPDVLALGDVRIDPQRRRAHVAGTEVALTALEFDLLAHLLRAPGRVFSREQLLDAVWGYPAGAGTRTVDVHVAQLRAKLGPRGPIRTVRGVGYAADEETGPVSSPRLRTSLGVRVAAGGLLVAFVAVGAMAAVAVALVSTTARQVTRDTLAAQADVVAARSDRDAAPGIDAVLAAQDVTVVRLGVPRPAGTPVATALARTRADRALSGSPVSAAAEVGPTTYLVEARPGPDGTDGAIALVRAADRGPLGVLRRDVGLALLAGAAVAVLAGVLVGVLVGRPLRAVAGAAHRLRGGARDVRVPVRGPAEVAEVAGAVNELADALARSEDRQRRFLLSVSHELRTPLTSVRGFGESLADGVLTGDDVPRAGSTIVREAQRLERLVADLMELARLDADEFALEMSDVDLTGLVVDAVAVWRRRAEDTGALVRAQTPDGAVVVRADPRRLRQAVDALAQNALRATPSGAPLVLAVHDDGTLQVRDGGPGLDPDDYPVAFERRVLHDRYDGRRPIGSGGIGLALVHGLVTRMGGTVTAEPAPEGGACFTIHLAPS